ncbi:MAG: DUF2723 domain-containing protein, partial [Gemmatimonadota bacterium]|nr:DUF2723 domain-containing protein [Gemmatimonadota bacterium]
MGGVLLASYLATMAPGVTFWDAGEFIAAAHTLGIPHPPGTPLFVAVGRVWTLALAPMLGTARAMNLLSGCCTVLAGAITAWLVARETGARSDTAWGAVAGALCAGLMATAWANATETEVYAAALVHVVLLLACANRAVDGAPRLGDRWLLCTAYLIALAPAVHLSALVGAPAAISLAARERDGRWQVDRALLLGGVLLSSAGVGRMSAPLVLFGAGVTLASLAARRSRHGDGSPRVAPVIAALGLCVLAATALLIMLVRARHDPPINQGNPATLTALADVVARRQYDVAGMWPRQAPVWLQLANVAQYVDWQIALDWGRGIFTTPARVLATVAYVALAALGAREMRRDSRRLADAFLVLLVCGTLGVATYLNLKAGASLGAGLIPDGAPHEARERDYFFVLGFWAWGCLCGYGALAIARARRWPPPVAVAAAGIILLGNWRTADRARGPGASAARTFALALLQSAPPNAALFVSGDNDSYPLWYAQRVEGVREDVVLVTLPLLPADWYARELARRTGWRWSDNQPVPGTRLRHEQRAALIARAARGAERPIAASPT